MAEQNLDGAGIVPSVSEGPSPLSVQRPGPSSPGHILELVDNLDAIVWEAHWPSWRYTFVNHRAESILGFPRARWLQESHFWMRHLHPDDRTAAIAFSLGNTERGRDHQHEFRMLSADGSVVWLREMVRIMADETGRACKLCGMMVDITAERSSLHALRLREQRYRTLYDENPLMFFSVSPNGVLQSVNDFGAQQLGYAVPELIGVRAADLHVPEEGRRLRAHFHNCLSHPDSVTRWETCLLRKDGKPMWVRVCGRAAETATGRPTLLILCEDVTQARERSRELAHQAKHDPLTTLINRAEFERRLQRVLYTAQEYQTEHVLGVLDIDQFKVINYCYGHAAGDEVLRELGEIIADVLQPSDTVARIGGDELGVLLENCSLERAKEIGAELLTVIAAHDFEWADCPVSITASVGLVPVRAHSDSVAELMSTADTACRTAAEKGRSRIHVSAADDREVADRQREMEWASQLEAALQNDRLRLHFQRIAPVRAASEQSAHYELLVRLLDSSGKLVTPGVFLPAAERYQLSTRLDRWVVARAVQWLASRPAASIERETCCINLSGHSLADPEFLKFALEQLSGAHVASRAICFEITETAVIADLARAMHCIQALKRAGCRFALDDFGSGLSSFAYLKRLPVDFLKIDGIFVRSIASDSNDLEFLRLINEIGHVTGKRTVAEFVESEEILAKLREVGVDYAQGFHIDRPRPLERFPGAGVRAGLAGTPGNVTAFTRRRQAT